MMLPAAFTFVFLAFPVFASAVSLIDALNANGASRFAQAIQANSTLFAMYSTARTVYAVPDTSFVKLARRQSTNPQALQMHSSKEITNLQTLSVFPGGVSHVQLPAKNGQDNAVVSKSKVNSSTSSSKARLRRQSGTAPPNPVSISSGLGGQVNIVHGDIPFDNGLIHIVDGAFTVPQTVSSTLTSTGLSSIQAILAQAGVSDTITNANSITFFMPSASALTTYIDTNNPSPDALKTLLLNHLVPNFSGYLPTLQDGMSLPSLGGQSMSISVKNNAYFVNGVEITSANTITDNGVIHTINGVLAPTTPTPSSVAASAGGSTAVAPATSPTVVASTSSLAPNTVAATVPATTSSKITAASPTTNLTVYTGAAGSLGGENPMAAAMAAGVVALLVY